MKTINSQRVIILDFSVAVNSALKQVTIDLSGTVWVNDANKAIYCKVIIAGSSLPDVSLPFVSTGSVVFTIPSILSGLDVTLLIIDNGITYSYTKSLSSIIIPEFSSRFVVDRENKKVLAVCRILPTINGVEGSQDSANVIAFNPRHEQTESTFMPFSMVYYPGRYEMDGELIALYLFSNKVSYYITYKVCSVFNVQSLNFNLIFARFHQLLLNQKTCDSQDLQIAFYYLSLVLVGAENNFDVSPFIEKIEDILGIKNLCEYQDIEEGTLAIDVLITGCNIIRTELGNTVHYKINNYDYIMDFSGTQGTVSKSVIVSGCKKTTTHTFDFNLITNLVVNNIKNNGGVVEILNDAMDSINPGCISTIAAWKAKTFAQKWKSILDKACSCITVPVVPPSLIFVLDCDSISTSDVFTVGEIKAGTLAVTLNYTSGIGNVAINVVNSGFTGVFLITGMNSNRVVNVPIQYNGSGAGGVVNILVTANDQECTVPITILAEACTVPLTPTVSYDAGDVIVSFLPATSLPPSYTVSRRRKSDPDILASYSVVGTPVLNIGNGRFEITETYGLSEINKVWVYKIVSNCVSDARPFTTIEYARITCPIVSIVVNGGSVTGTWPSLGGDVNRYVYGVYDNMGILIGSLRTLNAPIPPSISDVFSISTEGLYTIGVQAIVANTAWTSGICNYPFDIETQSNATFVNNSGDAAVLFINVVDNNTSSNPFDFLSGNGFPLDNTQENFYNHVGFSSILSVVYSATNGNFIAVMSRNMVIIDSISLVADGSVHTHSFDSQVFAANQDLRIEIQMSL